MPWPWNILKPETTGKQDACLKTCLATTKITWAAIIIWQNCWSGTMNVKRRSNGTSGGCSRQRKPMTATPTMSCERRMKIWQTSKAIHLLQQFQTFFRQLFLTDPSIRYAVAVSGGLDSVVLCELCQQAGLDFFLVHCKFTLRGAESERD